MYPDPAQLSDPVVPRSKLPTIDATVQAKCDALDGLVDGLIDDPRQCNFDATADLLLCPDDVERADCFTKMQVAAIQRVYDGPSGPGGQIHPGYPPGVENEMLGWDFWITGGQHAQVDGAPSGQYVMSRELMRYFIFGDPTYELQTFDFETNVSETEPIAALLNATEPDLTRFSQGDSKMIVFHGWADHAISALASIHYYEQVTKTMGNKEHVDDFFRLYLLPGVLHCGGGPGLDVVDWLAALELWVEQNVAPDFLLASKGLRTRPVCAYPARAVWDGAGDPNTASAFYCAETTLGGQIVGDSNNDGRFNAADVQHVLTARLYSTGEEASWQNGDWNGDGVFDRRDVVAALQSGNFR
jgi:feruloyl esterase